MALHRVESNQAPEPLKFANDILPSSRDQEALGKGR